MPRRRAPDRWEGRIGVWPLVVVYEERAAKGGVCYMRWWVPEKENWKWQSCKTKVRDERGKLDTLAQQRVIDMAKRQYDLLRGTLVETPVDTARPLLVSQAWPILTDTSEGPYPIRTPYRDELKRAIDDVMKEVGPDFAWMHLNMTVLTRILRRKVHEARKRGAATDRPVSGYRAAISLGTSVITIMNALSHKHLPANTPIPGGRLWRKQIKRYVTDLDGGREPEPQRPRYTLEELRKLHEKAPLVDPRFGLLMELAGVGQRGGQVVRAYRSSLDLERNLFRSPGRGDKKGALIELTPGQRRAVDAALAGYLRKLEGALADYPLFPQGILPLADGQPTALPERHGEAKPVVRRTIVTWHTEAETLAEIPHIDGRGFYGLKRRAVDASTDAGISADGLEQLGGWSSDRVAKGIYRDKEREKGRHEAMQHRARIRGENVAESYPAPETNETEAPAPDADATR